jgi:hypothetical protein
MRCALILLLWCTAASAAPELVFKDSSGRVLTQEDLVHATGTVRWELVGGEGVPPEASRLHQEARVAAQKEDYPRAHALLENAQRLAPRWPYPVYDDAFTHLLEGHDDQAEKLYAKVEQLAPRGFFTSQRELDCLRQQRKKILPAGFCMAYAMLEWMKPSERRTVLSGITAKFPAYAPAWLDLSKSIEDLKQRMVAIERGLSCSADAHTRGALLIDKALVLRDRGDREEAIRILGAVALDPRASLGNEAMAKLVLAEIVKRR